ncbi:MAG TPA: acyltransferase [Candidatus Limnocylindria bacterium]|nr:acyltransferase [Candidatus Limnocylindria bacterium]
MNRRLVWVDWLKGLVVFGVVAYHAAQPFVVTDWLVTNEERSLLLSGLAGVGYLFAMPLMFLLAGVASMLAIQRRSVRAYLGVRLLRLGLPLVVGLLLLSPFESWVGHLSRGGSDAFLAFSVAQLQDAGIGPSPVWLGAYGHHLWFLGFLLAYVLLSLPVLVWLRDRPPADLAGRLGTAGFVLVPPAVMALAQWPLRAAFPAYRDWADAILWLGYYGIGVLFVLDHRLIAMAGRVGPRMLVPGVLLVVLLAPIALSGDIWRFEATPRVDVAGLAYAVARTGIGWSLVLAVLSLGILRLDRWEAAGRRVGESSMALYVLHHPVAVVASAVVVSSDLGLWTKFLLTATVTFAVTGALYEGVVRRVAVLRGVFGVEPPTAEPSELPPGLSIDPEGAHR